MKKTGDILDLCVICIKEGKELGKVKGLLLDPDKGKVEYLLIIDRQWYLGAKLLFFDEVVAIGVDAVTIETQENIKEIMKVEEAMELANKDIKILGARVYTKEGKYIGRVQEYYIDSKEGTIIGCELEESNNYPMIQASDILTYGTNTLVINDIEQRSVQQDTPPFIEVEEANVQEQGDEEMPAASALFEQRQRQFLLGRKAKKTILDESGGTILEEGQTVTHETLDKIRNKGKIIELTMNTSP